MNRYRISRGTKAAASTSRSAPGSQAVNSCPMELWHLIFSYACTDGGHTARALSAVSRYIRECSKPYYNVQSVALHGTRQTLAFAAALETNPDHLRQIKHLFVSSDEVGSGDVISKKKTAGRSALASLMPFSRRKMPTPEQIRAKSIDSELELARALLSILAKISSSLQILTITFTCHWAALRSPAEISDMAILELPKLTDLSLAYRAVTDTAFTEFALQAPLSFPALRRLDLTGLELASYHTTRELCGRLGTIAPSLTHLHIPMRMALAGTRHCIPPRHGAAPPVTSKYHLSPTIQRVLVALCPAIKDHCYRADWGACDCWRCELEEIGADERVHMRRGRGSLGWRELKERLEAEWGERTNGGDGCWQ
ncbi:hypothetical protein HWV62_39375 [Athelia sp. TMB]|nr:hypothetical protein HWV62_39375 [Athelia sp. TMB]